VVLPEIMIVDGHTVEVIEVPELLTVRAKCSCGVLVKTWPRERVRYMIHRRHVGKDKKPVKEPKYK
jgi:hypothetical protein